MTSRPNLAGPQRSLSAANIIQRPPPNRTLSHQFPPSSPARRNIEGSVDLTLDGSEAGSGRYGTIPRNGGSRLKLEISKDSSNSAFVESPKPSSVATPVWKPSLPPRGRPQLHFDVPSVSNLSPRPSQDGKENNVVIKPMPLPARPGQYVPPVQEKSRNSPGNAAKKEARPKPYTLEVPSAAPRYPHNGHSDFFPWTGNHSEDQFSESAIRQGFYDKSQMTQNETGSAKPSIFPALKPKSGLQTLSSLFTSVLAQRRTHGQITSISTFKPPPRVTVTDTKREIWLRDLANPTISLRRLSRSIPHGIRGKVLLDQSMSKGIPVERAVWLAKCVGANELRSFRRKGVSGTFAMGGEAKWIRDFTVCVEQFIESIVGSCGEKDFKSRINYAIRLGAHFYDEYLLDREHYMDWLVSALENSPQAKLPMWILITQVYWKDLLRYRKYGRRLCSALMTQLSETTSHPDSDILAPLSDRLKTLLTNLMVSNPDSFVFSRGWAKHRQVLRSALTSDDSRIEEKFFSIDQRNERLDMIGTKRGPSSKRVLINKLDSTLSTSLTSKLVKQCWKVDEDKHMLIRTVVEWSTSSYRPGSAKIYVAVRMLRQWTRFGADITGAILTFLNSGTLQKGRNNSSFYHLVSELVRSEHFSASAYLQWIVARGGLDNALDVAQDGPCSTRLLVELPIHNLADSMIALRSTLLGRIGFSVDDEQTQIDSCKINLSNSLPGMQSNIDPATEIDRSIDKVPQEDLACLSRTIKSEVALWLRETVGLQMLQPTIPPLDDWDDSPMKQGSSAITPSQFITIRRHLEVLEDFSILADVLKLVTSSSDPEVLASCADTLDLHFDTFAAIGALNGLFDLLMTRLRSLNEDDAFPRVLLVALSCTAMKIPEQNIVAQQLSHELARSDRKTAADACSPVSDHMAGVVQTADTDFTDEIEKVLASGNSMDQATLERLFYRIALRLEESWKELPEQHRSCGLLFTRLRTFDAQQFDLLMIAWVSRFIQMDTRPSIIHVLGPLISFGCLTLPDVINTFIPDTATSISLSGQSAARVSEEMLALCISPLELPDVVTAEELYRLRVKQNNLQWDQRSEVLIGILKALEQSGSSASFTKNILSSKDMLELLQRQVLIDTDGTIRNFFTPLLHSNQIEVRHLTSKIVDKLLAVEEYLDEEDNIPIEAVLKIADDYTLPFCQIKLASSLRSDNMTNSDSGSLEAIQGFNDAIEAAVATENTTWTCILPLLDISIAQHLRSRAETQFLNLFPSPKNSFVDALATSKNKKQAETLLYIIDATAFSMAASIPNSPLMSEIPSALHSIWVLLSSSTSQYPERKAIILTHYLPLLLSFTTIHSTIFEATKLGHESRGRTLIALAAIFLELQALATTTPNITTLTEETFDLALQLVDLLPDDMRLQCIRALRDTTSNPRISYLFSVAANPIEWLYLSQKEKIACPPGPEGRGGGVEKEKLTPYVLRRWEMLGEPTPNVGENDTSLSLTLFSARRG